MQIRAERRSEAGAIASLTTEAFAGVIHSNQTEAGIVTRLRTADALALSLVALEHGTIIGHVAFSPVEVGGEATGWFGLGPVSVRPDRQRQGVGTALISQGLAELKASGAGGCVVLGEPSFYRRFGFATDPAMRYEEAPAEFFMGLAFRDEVPAGRVRYHPAFDAA
jgi:putative acetyltransferase